MNRISNIPNDRDIDTVDPFQDIPIECLGSRTRQKLAIYLNPTKVLMSEDGYHRDWRGVLHFTGLSRPCVSFLSKSSDQFGEMLKLWIEDKKEPATLAQLQKILGIIDRWEVLDDTMELFEKDATNYLNRMAKINKMIPNDMQLDIAKSNFKSDIIPITVQDMQRQRQGLPLEQYDAFVLFANEDIDFATKMINKIEDFCLKVFVKERDLLGGINFEHDAIRNLLTNRCNCLIVILSPAFLTSPANEFIANLAQSLGIAQRRRKIVPCLFQPCELPDVFQHMHIVNYQRSKAFNNFWEKLYNSLVNTTEAATVNSSKSILLHPPSITLTDYDTANEYNQTVSSGLITSTPQSSFLPQSTQSSIYSSPDFNRLVLTQLQISRSSPSSPNLLRKFLHIKTKRLVSSTQSLNTIDDRINNNLLTNGFTKKRKWYKKLLTSPVRRLITEVS